MQWRILRGGGRRGLTPPTPPFRGQIIGNIITLAIYHIDIINRLVRQKIKASFKKNPMTSNSKRRKEGSSEHFFQSITKRRL